MAEPEQPLTGPSAQPAKRTMGERFALLLTNLGKLGGLIVGFHEAFGAARAVVMLYATAIYIGSQALEDLILKIIERTFGSQR